MIATSLQLDRRTGALVNHHMFHRRTRLQSFFDRREQLDFRTPPIRTVLRDHRRSLRIVNAVDQCGRRKSAKHNRVRRADPGAG